MEDISTLEERKNDLMGEVLSIQASLGQKRMFHPDGTVMTLREFCVEKKKLKKAWTWRMIEVRKISEKLKSIRSEQSQKQKPSSRSKLIGVAFSLLCDDVATGNLPVGDDEQIASIYLGKAEVFMFKKEHKFAGEDVCACA